MKNANNERSGGMRAKSVFAPNLIFVIIYYIEYHINLILKPSSF